MASPDDQAEDHEKQEQESSKTTLWHLILSANEERCLKFKVGDVMFEP